MDTSGIEKKLGVIAGAIVSLDIAVKVFPYRWRHAQSMTPEKAIEFARDVERAGGEVLAKALGISGP